MSPFGAINTWTGRSNTTVELQGTTDIDKLSPLQITFKPGKQVLHDKSDLVTEIKDVNTLPDLSQLTIYYNSIDVTEPFMKSVQTQKLISEKSLLLKFKNLRFKIDNENSVRMIYKTDGKKYSAYFQEPDCYLEEEKQIHRIFGFNPPNQYLKWLQEIAKDTQINPGFLTGIVAQESAFDPKAVSWAKALGLTQITPLAEEQIMEMRKDWPRQRDIASLSYIELKAKVISGEINDQTDWRLSPKQSLQGGADYVKYLHSYWTLEENQKVLKTLKGEESLNLSKVILASYNSGPTRVKNSINDFGNNWLKDEKLKEANKYVRKVFSYCYHFSEKASL